MNVFSSSVVKFARVLRLSHPIFSVQLASVQLFRFRKNSGRKGSDSRGESSTLPSDAIHPATTSRCDFFLLRPQTLGECLITPRSDQKYTVTPAEGHPVGICFGRRLVSMPPRKRSTPCVPRPSEMTMNINMDSIPTSLSYGCLKKRLFMAPSGVNECVRPPFVPWDGCKLEANLVEGGLGVG